MMAAKSKKEPAMSDKKKNAAKKKLSKKQLKKQEKKQEKAVRKAAKKLAKKLSSGKSKLPKAAKANKVAAASSAASFQLNLGTCPCCSKHCPLSKPKCGKGRAVARKKRERLMGEAAA